MAGGVEFGHFDSYDLLWLNSAQDLPQLSWREPPGNCVVCGHVTWLQHVPVDVDPHASTVEGLDYASRRCMFRRDDSHAGRLQRFSFGCVDITRADEDCVLGPQARTVATVPESARARKHHPSEVSSDRGLWRVEVAVPVDVEDYGVRVFLRHYRQRSKAGGACVGRYNWEVAVSDTESECVT